MLEECRVGYQAGQCSSVELCGYSRHSETGRRDVDSPNDSLMAIKKPAFQEDGCQRIADQERCVRAMKWGTRTQFVPLAGLRYPVLSVPLICLIRYFTIYRRTIRSNTTASGSVISYLTTR